MPNGVTYSDRNGQPDQATFRDPFVQGAEFRSAGVWVEDKFTLKRLTVSLGARFDRMTGTSPDEPVRNLQLQETGATIAGLGEMFSWNAPAPRFGFNLKLSEKGDTVLRGAYGRAFRQVLTDDFVGVHPGLSPSTLARYDPATGKYSTIISVTSPNANLAVDPDLNAPYTDSFSVGLDRQLMKNVGVGVSVVHKNGHGEIGWVDIGGVYGQQSVVTPLGNTITVFPLVNATGARKYLRTDAPGGFLRYNGVILTMEKRMANRWRASFGYTYSKSEGKETSAQDPNQDIFTGGLRSFDRPHMILLTGAWDIPKADVFMAADLMSASGTPFAPQMQVTLPQGRLNVNIAESDGTYRQPFQNILSLRFSKYLFRQGDRRLELGAEIRNVLQDTGYEGVLSRIVGSSTFNQASSWVDPRRGVFYTRWYF